MRMFNAFDPQRKGALKLGDFVSMILFLKSCNRIFKAFDPQGCGQVVLDFQQFIYAVGSSRLGSETTALSAFDDPFRVESGGSMT